MVDLMILSPKRLSLALTLVLLCLLSTVISWCCGWWADVDRRNVSSSLTNWRCPWTGVCVASCTKLAGDVSVCLCMSVCVYLSVCVCVCVYLSVCVCVSVRGRRGTTTCYVISQLSLICFMDNSSLAFAVFSVNTQVSSLTRLHSSLSHCQWTRASTSRSLVALFLFVMWCVHSAHVAITWCLSVCLSVCLSITFLYCIKASHLVV